MLRRFAVGCLVLGIGTFVLPLMGFQFRLIEAMGPAGPIVGIVLIVVGGFLWFVSERK
jgi:hypothetical protein